MKRPKFTAKTVARNVAGAPVELAGLESHMHVDLVTGEAGCEFATDEITGAGCFVWREGGAVVKVGILSGVHLEDEDKYTEEELEEGVVGIARVRLTMFRIAA